MHDPKQGNEAVTSLGAAFDGARSTYHLAGHGREDWPLAKITFASVV